MGTRRRLVEYRRPYNYLYQIGPVVANMKEWMGERVPKYLSLPSSLECDNSSANAFSPVLASINRHTGLAKMNSLHTISLVVSFRGLQDFHSPPPLMLSS